MKTKPKKKGRCPIREAEKAICQNVQIERLPGNRTRLVQKDSKNG